MASPQRELVALDHHKLAMHPIGHINPAVHPDHALRSAQIEYARSAHQFGSCHLLSALCVTVLSIKRYSLCVASESGGQR